jgi:signal transduction histidine kinase
MWLMNPDNGHGILPDDDRRRLNLLHLLAGVAVLFGLYLTSLYSYLLFHSLAELFSIVIAFGIFVVAWNSRPFLDNNYLLFVGIAYLFVGGLDLTHTLAYKGMGIFKEYNANLATQLWIAARYMQSISLLIAPFFLGRRLNSNAVFAGYFLAFSFLLWSVFHSIFPSCYIEGVGLTPFKIFSEYIISVILLGAAFFLVRKRRLFDEDVLRLIIVSIIATVLSELMFTFYISVYDLSNLVGHILKIISFYFIYRAIIRTGIVKPYEIIFRNLKQREEALQKAHDELQVTNSDLAELNQEIETIVAERTMSLMALTVADSIRNPAAVIGWTCRKIAEKADLPEKMQEVIKDIMDQSAKLEQIVKNFETLLRSRQSIFQYEDVNEIVKSALSLEEKRIGEKGIAVSTRIEEQPLRMNVRRNLLRVALLHLLKNAAEATSEGGKITVATSRTNDFIGITISDTGSGIPREDIDKIFDPFFSTKKRRFGMGLPLVKQIAEEHLGKIAVESEVGKGTTFSLTFPIRWTEKKELFTVAGA